MPKHASNLVLTRRHAGSIAFRALVVAVLLSAGTAGAARAACFDPVDSDGDGAGDACDGCPADPVKRVPGHCGCGAPDADPDGDGVSSCLDNCATVPNLGQADLDGDGVGDACECAAGGCVTGGGSDYDCAAQLLPPVDADVSGTTFRCHDGDPCDVDPEPGVCGFELGLCFGGAGATPGCAAAPVREVSVEGDLGASARELVETIAALPAADLASPKRITFGFMTAGAPLCTEPAVVSVRVGERQLDLTTIAGAEGWSSDRDHIRLVCDGTPVPAPPEAEMSQALRCQRAIERGGARAARVRLQNAKSCARNGRRQSPACSDPAGQEAAFRLRYHWGIGDECHGVDVRALGYHDRCGAPGSACDFPSPVLGGPGLQDDILDCMTCQMNEAVKPFIEALVPIQSQANSCTRELTSRAGAIAGKLWKGLSTCLAGDDAISIAACTSDAKLGAKIGSEVAKWRARSSAACGNTDLTGLGYSQACSYYISQPPPLCTEGARPCNLLAGRFADRPGTDDDRLDCFECHATEVALALARIVYGAEICCIGDNCSTVRSRASCVALGGQPSYFEVETVAGDPPANAAHAIAVAPSGDVFVPHVDGPVVQIDPVTGTSAPVGVMGSFPVGLAVGPEGDLFGGMRYEHVVARLTLSGERSDFAGLFEESGHAGDGGFADEARIAAPDGVAFDAFGNLYLSESGFVASGLTGEEINEGEWVRKVDAAGRIQSVLGGPYGTAGLGGPAAAAQVALPYAITVRPTGTILVGEAGAQRLMELEPGGRLLPFAGRAIGIVGSYSGDGGPAALARLNGIEGIAADPDGKVYFADFRNTRIRMVDRLGSIVTIAGDGWIVEPLPAGAVPGVLTRVSCVPALAIAPDGRLYFPDLRRNVVRRLTLVPY